MANEQGFIEYVFEQHGAEALKQHVDEIERKVNSGVASFDELESTIQQIARVAPGLAASLGDAIEKASPTGLSRQWEALSEEITAVQRQYREFGQGQVLGDNSVTAPASDRSDIDTYIRARKAANADIVSDSIAAYRRIGQAEISIGKTASDQAFRDRKAKIGEEAALREQLATRQARLARAAAQVENASADDSAEGIQQQAAAADLYASRLAAVAQTERQLANVQQKAAADKQKADAQQAATLEKLNQQRNQAQGKAGEQEALRTQRERASQIGVEAEAQERRNRLLREEQQIRAQIAGVRGRTDSAGLQQQTQLYGQLAANIRQSEGAARDFKRSQEDIIAQRYSLYDLSTTYAAVGAALAGIGIYSVSVGANFQAAFTNVERTLSSGVAQESIDNLRQSLVQLQGQIPLTFQEITEIATIGNQMGVAEDQLLSFTGTIARFSSVAGISINETSKAFGGFLAQTGLGVEYLENLGSSLSLVSIESNATEAEILSVSKEIAALSANAGLGADQIVGLASTFAALRIQPERARGSLGTYFGTLRKAVAGGGQDLQNFATVVGVTAEELDNLVRSGQGAEVLEGFLSNLNNTDAIGVTQALDALGLSQLRVEDSFIRLSSRLDIFREQMQLANQGFVQGSELNRQYEKTVDDLSSQWIIFINGLNSLIATITGDAIPGIAGLLAGVNRVIFAFQAWLNNNTWARTLIVFGGAIVTVVGVMALLRGLTLRATASILAYRTAIANATGTAVGATGAFRGLASAMFGAGSAGVAGARGLSIFRQALVRTGFGAAVVGLGYLADKFLFTDKSAENASLSMDQYNKAIADSQSQGKQTAETNEDLAKSLAGGGGGGGGTDSVAGAAEEAAKKVRTLADYASDLSSVFARAFDIRFSADGSIDKVNKQIADLNDRLAKNRSEVRSLTADRRLQEYFLRIAESYNDQLRAGELRENIAKIDDDLAEANKGASTELRGNSVAAIENRNTIRELSKGYQDYLVQLASSGASQETLQRESERLRAEFYRQGEQLGFSREELDKYGQSFSDVSTIISQVPADITVGFNGDAAQQALNEFFAKAQEDAAAAGTAAGAGAADGLGSGFDAGVGDFEAPGFEFEEDPAAVGEKTGEEFVTGLASGIAKFIGEKVRGAFQFLKNDLPRIIQDTFSPSIIGSGFNFGKNPFLAPILRLFGEAGTEGGKATNEGAKAETRKLTFSDLIILGGSTGFLQGWFGLGESGGKGLNDGVESSADPDGTVARKLSSGGGGGAGAVAGMGRLGSDASEELNRRILEVSNPQREIGTNIAKSRIPLANLLGGVGATGAGNYNSRLGSTSNSSGVLGRNVRNADGTVASSARGVGSTAGYSYNDRLSATSNTSGVIGGNIDAAVFPAGNAARYLGSVIGSAISGGISGILDGIFGASGRSRTIVRRLTGFSGGGYTGAGHWQQPAGVVHRGEYVIPKKHVDQRTGIPDMGYVQSIQHSRPAPKASYATGGFVGGQGGFGGGTVNVRLDAASIQAIAQAVPQYIQADGRILGEVTSNAFVQSNAVGAN